MRELTVGKNDAGQRLDRFLQKALPSLPPSLLYKSLRTKKIKCNRKRAEGNQMLSEGDVLQLFLKEEFFSSQEGQEDLSAVKGELSIVYEDENLLLLNKRPGLVVHEDDEGNRNTLILRIRAYLYQKGEYDPEKEQSFSPALCNRIDRNTGGIVIAAKNAEALREMNHKLRERTLSKFYLCAVHGAPTPKEGILEGFLLKDEVKKTVSVFDKNPPRGAKPIKTGYRTLAVKGELALLEVALFTGRTHQIRAHMAHVGHPLLGDGKYGVNREDRREGYRYQALYAYKLRFDPDPACRLLSYLDGKEFTVPDEAITFLQDFR